MSLTYEIKSNEPRQLPCETPDIVSVALLLNPSTTTSSLRSQRKERIQSFKVPFIPKADSLPKSLTCGIELKVFLKSKYTTSTSCPNLLQM